MTSLLERHANGPVRPQGRTFRITQPRGLRVWYLGMPPGLRKGVTTENLISGPSAIDFLATARIGDWMQITPRVLRAGGATGFVDALVTANGETVARANAIFRDSRLMETTMRKVQRFPKPKVGGSTPSGTANVFEVSENREMPVVTSRLQVPASPPVRASTPECTPVQYQRAARFPISSHR